jgi:serine/threonine protein kinase
MPLAANSRLGHYEIKSSLGVGGMGEVYRAHDSRLDRDVAIKVLRSDSAIAKPARWPPSTIPT